MPIPVSSSFNLDLKGRWSTDSSYDPSKAALTVNMRRFNRGQTGYNETLHAIDEMTKDLTYNMHEQSLAENLQDLLFFKYEDTAEVAVAADTTATTATKTAAFATTNTTTAPEVDLEASFHVDLQLLLDPGKTGQLYLESGCGGSPNTLPTSISLELTTNPSFAASLARDRSFIAIEMSTMGDNGICPPGTSRSLSSKSSLGSCQLEFDVNVAVLVAATNRNLARLLAAPNTTATPDDIAARICKHFIHRVSGTTPDMCAATSTLSTVPAPSKFTSRKFSAKTPVVYAPDKPPSGLFNEVDYNYKYGPSATPNATMSLYIAVGGRLFKPVLGHWDGKCDRDKCGSTRGNAECQVPDLVLDLVAHDHLFSLSADKFFSASIGKIVGEDKLSTTGLECGRVGDATDENTLVGEFEKSMTKFRETCEWNEVQVRRAGRLINDRASGIAGAVLRTTAVRSTFRAFRSEQRANVLSPAPRSALWAEHLRCGRLSRHALFTRPQLPLNPSFAPHSPLIPPSFHPLYTPSLHALPFDTRFARAGLVLKGHDWRWLVRQGEQQPVLQLRRRGLLPGNVRRFGVRVRRGGV